jgi:hypothetical protein
MIYTQPSTVALGSIDEKNHRLFACFVAVSSLALTALSQATSQTDSIKVLDYNWYIDSSGFLIVIGEVQNTGQNTVANVTLGGTLTTADGAQGYANTMVWVIDLVPQQKAPFYLQFSSLDYSMLVNGEISVDFQVYQAEATSNYLYPDVVVTDSQGSTAQDGTFWVNGNLQNTGSQPAKDIRVVATFYNSEGKISGAGYTDTLTPNPLATSQTMSFKVGAFDLNQTIVSEDQKIARYSLLVQVAGTVLQGEAPVITATPTPGPITTETAGPSSSQSGTKTTGIDSTNTYIAVIVVAVAAILAVVVLLKKYISKPAAETPTAKSPQKAKRKKK